MATKVGIIGTGYVGLVSGTTFAAMGNEAWCVDIDQNKLAKMKQGICPIFEPGLDVLMKQGIEANRLFFTDDLESTILKCDVIFLCLPTPPNEDGSADLDHVMNTTRDIAEIIKKKNITDNRILVDKSTVPVGTSDKVLDILNEVLGNNHNVEVCSNPEFLREGFAVDDAMKPDRIVVGTSSEYVERVMRNLYKPFLRTGNPIIFMDEKSAEVTKYAANSMLAVKISFMNDLSRYCETVGADIEKIRMGIGSDTRIGKRFIFPGIGYGGSCFPKDVKAIIFSAEEAGTPLSVISAAKQVNDTQIPHFYKKLKDAFKGNLKGKRITLWGLAFKPNTDDTREAPAFHLIDLLLKDGADIIACDPEAIENTKRIFGDKIEYTKDMYKATNNSECLILTTEWGSFRNPDMEVLADTMKRKLIFDGRNQYNIKDMQQYGFEYHCVGRKNA